MLFMRIGQEALSVVTIVVLEILIITHRNEVVVVKDLVEFVIRIQDSSAASFSDLGDFLLSINM